MIIDTSFNLSNNLSILTVSGCPGCGEEDSQAGVTVTIDAEVGNDVSAQPSGK